MKKLLIILTVLLLTSCNPCKYVAKHPECFQPDTVKITDIQVHVEKETIKIDSIIYDTIPGKDNFIEKTVYLTKEKVKVDTIYQNKEISKINPLNIALQANYNDLSEKYFKAKAKNQLKNKIGVGIGIILLLFLLYRIFLK